MLIEHLIILSIIQGITEFIPVSSTAHLILFPNLSSYTDHGLVIDVAVHFGSLLAVCVYLWREIIFMLTGSIFIETYDLKRFKLFIFIIFGSIPLIVLGYFLHKNNFLFLRSVETIAWCTVIFGILLYISDNFFLRIKKIKDLSIFSILVIGLFQLLAFLPGTSRAGIVITSARILGFDRITAVRFSLLLSIPAILGATALQGFEIYNKGDYELGWDFIIASLLSFLTALLSIILMIKWLKFSSFTPFVIYRTFLGIILLLAIYFW